MKVSDFKLAEHIIRLVCRQHQVSFVDVDVRFDTPSDAFDGTLVVAESDRWGKTIYQIVVAYLQHMHQITGAVFNVTNEEWQMMANWTVALIRDFSYSNQTFPEAIPQKPTVLRINRDPFVWLILRDIIAPSYQIPIKNTRVVAMKTSKYDGAVFENAEEPVIILNMDIENQSARTAHLLYAAIQSQGLNAKEVCTALLTRDELKTSFLGLVKAAFVYRESINTFITMFGILCDFSQREELLEMAKVAKWNGQKGLWSQAQYDPSGWWYLGLLEKSLEPARGPDWSGYFTLKPFTDELWSKIEREKEKRGLPTLSMEALLRIQSEEYHQRGDLILQGLLADNRVW